MVIDNLFKQKKYIYLLSHNICISLKKNIDFAKQKYKKYFNNEVFEKDEKNEINKKIDFILNNINNINNIDNINKKYYRSQYLIVLLILFIIFTNNKFINVFLYIKNYFKKKTNYFYEIITKNVNTKTLVSENIYSNNLINKNIRTNNATIDNLKNNNMDSNQINSNNATINNLKNNNIDSDNILSYHANIHNIKNNKIDSDNAHISELDSILIQSNQIITSHLKSQTSDLVKIKANEIETNDLNIVSDKRKKKNILYNSISSDLLDKIDIVSFEYKGEENNHIGFIAQDIQKYYPQLINTDSNGYLTVKYLEMIPLLLDYNKNLKKSFINLEKNIKNNQLIN
jgi:hypothetical protein